MIWEPRAVYGFVRAAGFHTDEWGPAVALVLACSGGDDLYRDVSYPGPALDRRGLFALDLVAHPELDAVDLFDPRANCRAAYALSTASNGAWDWAGCPLPPTDSEAFTAAKAAVRAGPAGQGLTSQWSAAAQRFTFTQTQRDLAGISDYVRGRIATGGMAS